MNTKHTRNGTFPAPVTAATQPAGIGLQTDYHTHTTFSPDGSSTPEAMCQRALDLDPADCRKYAESRSWTRSTEQFVSNLAPRTGAECKLSNQYQT